MVPLARKHFEGLEGYRVWVRLVRYTRFVLNSVLHLSIYDISLKHMILRANVGLSRLDQRQACLKRLIPLNERSW